MVERKSFLLGSVSSLVLIFLPQLWSTITSIPTIATISDNKKEPVLSPGKAPATYFDNDDAADDGTASLMGNDRRPTTRTTYVFPSDGKPDPLPTARLMAVLPTNNTADDPGVQALFGKNIVSNVASGGSCEVTSLFRLERNDDMSSTQSTTSTDDDDDWVLTTWNLQGQPKSIGGDELYITYTPQGLHEPTAVANITDWDNGTYTFHFVRVPFWNATATETPAGTLEIVMEQTCGAGRLPPPLKQNWNHMTGAINAFYQQTNITEPQNIRPFRSPNQDGSTIDLGSFQHVVAVGDSVMGQFVRSEHNWQNETFYPNIYRRSQIAAKLNTETVTIFLDMVRNNIREALKRLDPNQKHMEKEVAKVALIIGSGVWDILKDEKGEINFEDHLEACEKLVLALQSEHPDVVLYWKSMTAMHNHRVVVGKKVEQKTATAGWMRVERLTYMSNFRARHLDQLQKALMARLNVTVIDVFDAFYCSAHYSRLGDGRHFQASFNEKVIRWFYPNHHG